MLEFLLFCTLHMTLILLSRCLIKSHSFLRAKKRNLFWFLSVINLCIQLFQLRLSPEQSGKVEYERERLLGIANKFIHLLAIPSSLSCSYSTLIFRFAWGTILIEIAVYSLYNVVNAPSSKQT
jgi:hypothetical protein